MAILAGIDEAGYGPLLGPLVVSGAAFRVPEEQLDTCLWSTLAETCTRDVRKSSRKLAITDSKKLYQSRKTLAPLERAALVMLAVSGERPTSFEALLETVSPGAVNALAPYPWYREANVEIPVSDDLGDVATRANAVRRDAQTAGVTFVGAFAEPLAEGDYNRMVLRTRNKAVVSFGLALRVIDRLVKFAPKETIRVCIDRQGGRTHYRDPISTAMPEYDMHVLEETDARSAYRLECASRVCHIEFTTNAEDRHFAVALGSIYSKYLRELYMHQFNRYWATRQRGLKSTAGYYTDAQRWLKEAGDTLRQLKVDRTMLVRQR